MECLCGITHARPFTHDIHLARVMKARLCKLMLTIQPRHPPPGHPGRVNYQIRPADKRLPTSTTSISWPYLTRHLPSADLQCQHEGTHTETIPLIARGDRANGSISKNNTRTAILKDSQRKYKHFHAPFLQDVHWKQIKRSRIIWKTSDQDTPRRSPRWNVNPPLR